MTASVWPSASPSSSRPCSAVSPFIGSVAACSERGRRPGTGTTDAAGTTRSSACAPPSGRRGAIAAITSSPTATCSTPSPTDSTTPAASMPGHPRRRQSLDAALPQPDVRRVHGGGAHREPDLARRPARAPRARSRAGPPARPARVIPTARAVVTAASSSSATVSSVTCGSTPLRHAGQVERAADPAPDEHGHRAAEAAERDVEARRRRRSRRSPPRERRAASPARAPPHARACRRRSAERRSPSRSRRSASRPG